MNLRKLFLKLVLLDGCIGKALGGLRLLTITSKRHRVFRWINSDGASCNSVTALLFTLWGLCLTSINLFNGLNRCYMHLEFTITSFQTPSFSLLQGVFLLPHSWFFSGLFSLASGHGQHRY